MKITGIILSSLLLLYSVFIFTVSAAVGTAYPLDPLNIMSFALAVLPSLSLLISFLISRGKKRKIFLRVFALVILVPMIAINSVLIYVNGISSVPDILTKPVAFRANSYTGDVEDYGDIYEDYFYCVTVHELCTVFPEEIPESAENVRYRYHYYRFPFNFNDDSVIKLSYSVDEDTFQREYARIKNIYDRLYEKQGKVMAGDGEFRFGDIGVMPINSYAVVTTNEAGRTITYEAHIRFGM